MLFVLIPSGLALDCSLVELPGVVPQPTQDSHPILTVDFMSVLSQIAHLSKFYQLFKLEDDPASNKTITTPHLSQCLILGEPVAWEDMQEFETKGKAVVLQGYFGRAKAEGKDDVAEACLIDNFIFLNQKCSSFSRFKTSKISFVPYGQIDNQVMLPILKDSEIKFVNLGDDSEGPFICKPTPVTKLITDFELALKNVYCSMQDFFSLIVPKSTVAGCSDFELRIAEALATENIDPNQTDLASVCSALPKFECPSRFTRTSQFSSQMLRELSLLSLNALERAITKISNSLLRQSFPKLNNGLKNSLGPYPEEVNPISYEDWVLTFRITSKLTLAKQQHADRKLKALVWLLDLKDSLRTVTKTFFDKFNLIISQLSASSSSCEAHPTEPLFECSSKAMIKNFENNQFNLYTDKQTFSVGSLYYISCFSQTIFNLKTNRQIFLKQNDSFVNENATIPITCLSPHRFSYDKCYKFLSLDFSPNLKIGNTEILLASAQNDVLLINKSPFTIWFNNNTKLQNERSYRLNIHSFPISIHQGAGVADFVDSKFILNRIGYELIVSSALLQFQNFKSFTTAQVSSLLPTQATTFYNQLSAAEIALIVIVSCIILFIIFKFISKSSCFVNFKYNRKQADRKTYVSVNSKPNEYFPLEFKESEQDKAENFKKVIKTFLETGTWISQSHLDVTDKEVMDHILNAIIESRKQCVMFKPQLEIKDKNGKLEIIQKEFSMALCLMESLSERICPCLVPVHVCAPTDVYKQPKPKPKVKVENAVETSALIPTAPPAES